ncbi:MAG: hypothetical protein IJP12_02410 [Methanobrevibacter sp.]|nr:hypothetical protein [Methanobrevibacter sp.]
MNNISLLLEDSPLFNKKEYYDFLTVYDMTEYLFKDKNLILSNKSFIKNILKRFEDLIFNKNSMENNGEIALYRTEYDNFLRFLEEREEYFLFEIYHYNGTDMELITKIANKL